jgi:hypothetical protein
MPLNKFDSEIHTTIELLRRNRVVFEPGLSNSEIERIEKAFGFTFPPDLRAFLQTALPIHVESAWGKDVFPNWRSGDQAEIQKRLEWPFEGMTFDIGNNEFWPAEWGTKPANLAHTVKIARKHVDAAPKLIPLFSHRYLPASPPLPGNPVFSVYQTDIIIYGRNLWDYFFHEFEQQTWLQRNIDQGLTEEEFHASLREIPFWTKLAG